jgi:hypothetical protein
MAATSIVKLSLESAQYEQKLRGAKRQFEDFTNSIGINMKQLTAAGIAIGVATTAINAFTSACSEAITQSVELAREAEGIKRAFDRIDKPDLLQNLREATHNTVSDLELMKNAVKFDNFNLSLDQMGTFLAFAQQQANLLTVNSITPTNGCAVVTIATETSNVTASLDEMLNAFQQMTGVIKAEVLAAG